MGFRFSRVHISRGEKKGIDFCRAAPFSRFFLVHTPPYLRVAPLRASLFISPITPKQRTDIYIVYVCWDKIRTAHFKTQKTHSAFLPLGLTFSPYGTSTFDPISIIRLLKFTQPRAWLDAVYILPPAPEIVKFFSTGELFFASCFAPYSRVSSCIVLYCWVSSSIVAFCPTRTSFMRLYTTLPCFTRLYTTIRGYTFRGVFLSCFKKILGVILCTRKLIIPNAGVKYYRASRTAFGFDKKRVRKKKWKRERTT